jgi:very-short-patch-repair endonuclease
MRIKIPQPAFRPFHIKQKRMIQRGKYQQNPTWWIFHRRGLMRPRVGVDPLEARATSHDLVKGTKPERIVYQFLLRLSMVPQIDFTFQSSLEGGRIEMGGLVVDFLFPQMKMVLQVQGPTHDTFLRSAKDEEQHMLLSAMGYEVVSIDMETIYDEPRFEDAMRQLFGLAGFNNGQVHGAYQAPEEGRYDEIQVIGSRVDLVYDLFSQAAQHLGGL